MITAEQERFSNEIVRAMKITLSRALDNSADDPKRWVQKVAAAAMGSDKIADLRRVDLRIRALIKETEYKLGSDGRIHDHEAAVEWGFLERMRSQYVAGRYLSISNSFEDLTAEAPRLVFSRAIEGLYLHSLLERNSDTILPALKLIHDYGEVDQAQFEECISQNSQHKQLSVSNANFRPSTSLHIYKTKLNEWSINWANAPNRASKVFRPNANVPEQFESKTRAGYRQRAVRILGELGYKEEVNGRPRLTETGTRLYAALSDQGWIREGKNEFRSTIDPSAETVTDALSITIETYSNTYSHSSRAGMFEEVIAKTLIPEAIPEPWQENELAIACLMRGAIRMLGDSISATARIDDLRLAIFLYMIGKDKYIQFDDEQKGWQNYDVNRNGIARIALKNPLDFRVGHARASNRIWSVSLVRK